MTTLSIETGVKRAGLAAWPWARWALPSILAIYLLLGLLWSFVVPLGEGPDEPAHFQYVLFLSHAGRLPVQTGRSVSTDVSGEAHQPPLAYVLMQPFVAMARGSQSTLKLYENPFFQWSGGQDPNAFLHSLQERPPYHGLALVWHLARLVSVVLGGISVALCYAMIRRLWPGAPGLAAGGAALIAFNPQWLFSHALVSNDPLLTTLASALVYAAVIAAGPPRPRRSEIRERSAVQRFHVPLICGGILGLMLITKQSAIAFVPVPLLALFLGRRDIRSWLEESVALLTIAVLVGGWWYLRNWSLYGDPLGLQTFQTDFGGGAFRVGSWESWRAGGWNLLRSSLGLFGWMTLPLPDGAYLIARAALVVAGAGLLASLGAGVWSGRGREATVLLVAAGLVLLWIVLFAMTTGTVGWPGRFIFPAAPAFAVLLAVGLAYALPRRAGLVAIPALCLVLGAWLPFGLIQSSYSSPALPESVVPKGGPYARFDFGWKRAFELYDASFEPVAQTGTTVPVTFTWHLVEQVGRPYTIFIHLVDQHKTIVAKTDAQPLGGRPPTSAWAPGDWFRDAQHLSLAGVPSGTYHLWVGLFDTTGYKRLGVYNRKGKLIGDGLDLGVFRVEAATK